MCKIIDLMASFFISTFLLRKRVTIYGGDIPGEVFVFHSIKNRNGDWHAWYASEYDNSHDICEVVSQSRMLSRAKCWKLLHDDYMTSKKQYREWLKKN